ncbi:MAG: hypothetical protein PG981_000491 [Wolbachia endosymbiont of Ctenocephalides orientis wCori]|nr:MAG: hypothetical protein PG981_000491 [Wolbachia endosymbiont of Ctenocephalides orientis wCori]
MNNNYYRELGKSNYSYYTEHMSSCVKNPIFLELLSNVVMPLYNDGMLLKTFDTLCPGENNQSKVEKICGLYDSLSNKDELDLNNVDDVITYTTQIGGVVGNAVQLYYMGQECDFFKNVANDNLPKPDLLSLAQAAYYSAQSENNPALKNAQLVIN